MSPNLLVPGAYDVAVTATMIAALVVMVVALVVWFKERRNGWHGLVEVAVIVVMPSATAAASPAGLIVATLTLLEVQALRPVMFCVGAPPE